jgi:hypothetical protein
LNYAVVAKLRVHFKLGIVDVLVDPVSFNLVDDVPGGQLFQLVNFAFGYCDAVGQPEHLCCQLPYQFERPH